MAGIYIHIPFCESRCIYCGFYSTLLSGEWKSRYVDALLKEMEKRKDYLKGEKIETIYLGGGTPSQLSVHLLAKIFESLYREFDIATEPEITLEANPDDLSEQYVASLRTLPVNRISMGVQTFDNHKLRFLRRRHSAQEAEDAINRCRKFGFHNLSIDLIYGLPDETDESWDTDLRKALSLRVPHLSAYCLMYEEGTPLYKLKETGKVQEDSDTDNLQFYTMLVERLKAAGYTHYEISNFCLPGFRAKHNSSYWNDTPYLGLGAAAHSYNGQSRQWNIASVKDYVEAVETSLWEGCIPAEKEELTLYDHYNDLITTAMRTSEGISLSHTEKMFGTEIKNYLLRCADTALKAGNLQLSNGRLHLTEKGVFVSDEVLSDLIWV